MTIEESIQVLCANVMVAVDRADMGEACSKMVEDALNMAIASLEAWEKVKQEIEDMLETLSDGGDDWFTAEKLNDVLEVIDKHLSEIKNG